MSLRVRLSRVGPKGTGKQESNWLERMTRHTSDINNERQAFQQRPAVPSAAGPKLERGRRFVQLGTAQAGVLNTPVSIQALLTKLHQSVAKPLWTYA